MLLRCPRGRLHLGKFEYLARLISSRLLGDGLRHVLSQSCKRHRHHLPDEPCRRYGHYLRRRVGYEQFLARNADALAAMLSVNLGNMSLQPIGVLPAPFTLRKALQQWPRPLSPPIGGADWRRTTEGYVGVAVGALRENSRQLAAQLSARRKAIWE